MTPLQHSNRNIYALMLVCIWHGHYVSAPIVLAKQASEQSATYASGLACQRSVFDQVLHHKIALAHAACMRQHTCSDRQAGPCCSIG